jgi:hypothetical protein
VTYLGFLSQLLALIGGSITFWGLVVDVTDKVIMKVKKGHGQTDVELKNTI